MTNATGRYPRSLRRGLVQDLRVYPIVAVMGARQVGKSTLCGDIASELRFARRTLDDRDAREQAQSDPEGFLADLGDHGAFIDEVQRAPELMLALKAVVDREQRPGRYLLSGSNQSKVGRAVSDSLLGRAAYRTLRPLTLSELRFDDVHAGWTFLFDADDRGVQKELERRAASSGRLEWQTIVQAGGFPRAVAAPPEQRSRLLDDYIQVFSNRDVRELVAVDSAARFEAFVRLVSARSGQELNASGLSNDLGIPVSTVRRWIEALQRSYLIETVPAYSRNAGERVIKAPKVFLVDPALALAAAREPTPTGFHLETMVASDMQVWKDQGAGRGLHHWRLGTGQEVDFILEETGRLVPVEVKATTSVDGRDARHLRTFRERHDNTPRALLLSCDADIREIGQGIIAAPWWAVL